MEVDHNVIKDGGSEKSCDGKAIRIANSKFEDTMKVPKSSCEFVDTNSFAKIDTKGNVDILAYSGKIIKDHWWWGDLAIDISGAEFPKKFFPILEQHDFMRKIGFSAKPITDDNQLAIKNITFVETSAAAEFQDNSKKGFPYEASISVRPSVIESLDENATAEVNGYKMKGPGTIFRKWVYKETSVCVFGADSRTKSKALAEDEEEIEVSLVNTKNDLLFEEGKDIDLNKEVKTVDLKELKEKDLNAYAALMQEAKDSIKVEVETPLNAKISELSEIVTKQNVRLEQQDVKILSFEKTELVRQEKERKATAQKIWTEKLVASNIPDHLYEKVQVHVSYTKFVKDGEFDEAAFTAAVETEIASWGELGFNDKSVSGLSFKKKDVADSKLASEQEEDQKWIENMKKLAGDFVSVH